MNAFIVWLLLIILLLVLLALGDIRCAGGAVLPPAGPVDHCRGSGAGDRPGVPDVFSSKTG